MDNRPKFETTWHVPNCHSEKLNGIKNLSLQAHNEKYTGSTYLEYMPRDHLNGKKGFEGQMKTYFRPLDTQTMKQQQGRDKYAMFGPAADISSEEEDEYDKPEMVKHFHSMRGHEMRLLAYRDLSTGRPPYVEGGPLNYYPRTFAQPSNKPEWVYHMHMPDKQLAIGDRTKPASIITDERNLAEAKSKIQNQIPSVDTFYKDLKSLQEYEAEPTLRDKVLKPNSDGDQGHRSRAQFNVEVEENWSDSTTEYSDDPSVYQSRRSSHKPSYAYRQGRFSGDGEEIDTAPKSFSRKIREAWSPPAMSLPKAFAFAPISTSKLRSVQETPLTAKGTARSRRGKPTPRTKPTPRNKTTPRTKPKTRTKKITPRSSNSWLVAEKKTARKHRSVDGKFNLEIQFLRDTIESARSHMVHKSPSSRSRGQRSSRKKRFAKSPISNRSSSNFSNYSRPTSSRNQARMKSGRAPDSSRSVRSVRPMEYNSTRGQSTLLRNTIRRNAEKKQNR